MTGIQFDENVGPSRLSILLFDTRSVLAIEQ